MDERTRMESSVVNDPDLAIGTAKELVETCCKTILSERGITIPKGADLPQLVKLTSKELQLTPDYIPGQAKAADTIKRLLSNLATSTQGIAELRIVRDWPREIFQGEGTYVSPRETCCRVGLNASRFPLGDSQS